MQRQWHGWRLWSTGFACCSVLLLRLATAGADPGNPDSTAASAGSVEPLDEVVVTATLRATQATAVPTSVTVLDAATLREAGRQSFEDVLDMVPNLNWAGDTSRPRYFQIRGIGELADYQGAPNASVGFVIDDIDFSGLGSAATLFDVDHIEVLRGPQGARYGANALAGLIYVQSVAPQDSFSAHADLGFGDYGTRSQGAVITGPVAALDSSFRLAAQHFYSNGYYDNAYLVRDDTNRLDESTVRARWKYQPSPELRVDLILLDVQMDNGYDAWSIDNTRTTESDQPGIDAQHSTGVALKINYAPAAGLETTVIGSYARSLIQYGYDGDWGNPVLWAPYTYEYTELQNRVRDTQSFEARIGSPASTGFSWLLGIYGLDLHESFQDISAGLYVDPFAAADSSQSLTVLSSQYESRNLAVFAQLDGELAPKLRWTAGLRGERRTTDYHDLTTNLGAAPASNQFSPSNDLWGGNASLTWAMSADQNLYGLIARGYKAGGFNISQGLPADQLLFRPESDLNFESGFKAQLLQRRLVLDADVFYMRRQSEQVNTSEQLDPTNPDTFTYYTGNASSGFNYGLEADLAWRASERWTLGGALGLLQTRYHGFMQNGQILPDRALPNASPWQLALNAVYRHPDGWFARLDATGRGASYFDLPPNPASSKAYALLHARLGWESRRWSLSLWGHNLLNKSYAVRGFYFGDVPPNFPNAVYTQLGDPRTFGLDLSLRFE